MTKFINVPSVVIQDRMYIFETEAYEIEYGSNITRIYVDDTYYDAFLELNPTAPLKTFNPSAIQSGYPEWYEYVTIAIDEDLNSALLSLLYDAGLIEDQDYATYAEIRAINSSQFADAFSSASSLTSFDEFELFTGVKKLGDYAFSGCPNMESIKFPESVYKLGKNVLAGCNSLENVEVDGNNAHFYSPEGSNLIVDKTTRTIVAGCGSSTIPSDVYYIGDYAFAGSNLTEITIPSNIREIGDHAFDGCSALEYVEMESENPPKIGDNVFDDVSEDFEIDVPEDAVETYTEDDEWSQYAEYINGGQPQPHPKDLSDDEFGLESNDITITNEQMPVIIPLVNTHDLPVTYASSDTSIATVDQTGAVTLSYDNGNTNITVSFAGNDEYKAKTLTYAVTVAIPQELSDAEFSWSASSATATEAGSFSGVTLINTHGLSVSYSSSDTSVATIEPTYGHVMVSADGTTVISAAFAGNAQYKAKTVTYTLTVALAQDLTDQEFGLSSSSTTISTEGATVTLPVINIYNLPVTYTTSNNVVATVDANGDVTLSYVDGVALISIAFAGNSTYKAKTLVYSITVDMPAQIEHVMHTTFSISQAQVGTDTKLMRDEAHMSYFNSMIIDNVEMPVTYTYNFSTAGEHSVDYKIIKSNPDLPRTLFNGINQLNTCYMPDGITAVRYQTFFNNTGVSYISVPNGVTSLEAQSFRGTTHLQTVYLPDTVAHINTASFKSSGIESIKIPAGVTQLISNSFESCTNLTYIEIPATVTSIESQVFYKCSNLATVVSYNTTPPALNAQAFADTALDAIYVPFANVPDYQAANNWSTYASIIQPIGGKHTLTDAEFNLDDVPADINNSENITNYITNTHNLPLTFSSSDTSIMTINSNGYIEVVSDGHATITVTFAGNGQYLPKTLTAYLYGYISSISNYPVKLTSHPISESKAEKYSYTKIFSSITNKYYPDVYDIDVSENITSILVDGNEIGTSSYLYTFNNPTEEHTVEYSFVDNVNLPKWTFRRDTKFSSVVQNEYYDNKYPLRNYPTTYMISNNASSDVLEIGEGVESIGSSFFNGAAIKRIVLPSTFKFAYNYAFNGIKELKRIYSYAATPPILSYVSRSNEQVSIYGSADANGNVPYPNFYLIVPDESVELYRNSAYWQQTWSSLSKIKEYIIGFSQEPYIGKYGIVTKVSSDGENPTQIFNGNKYTAEPQQNLLMASLLSTTTDNNFDIETFWNDVNEVIIDGNEVDDVNGASYMFTTAGEHTVKYNFAYSNVIPSYFFADVDSISTAYISDMVNKVDEAAFSGSSVANVYLPETVTNIENGAFYDTNISYLEILATTPPTLGDNVFSTEPDYISVPTAYENDYKQASGWSDYEDVINPEPVPSYIVRTTFTISDISSPTQIANSDKLGNIYSMVVDGNKMAPTTTYQFTSTGDHSVDYKIYTTQPYILGGQFAHLTYMSYCIVPDGITQIKDRDAFHSTNITGVILPNTLTYLGGGTFVSTKLTHIIIPDSVTGFGDCLFQGAFDLTSAVVGDGVRSITQACFAFCGALNDLSLPSTITSVGRDVFYNNNSLSSVKVRANTNAAFCANTTVMNVLNKKSVNIIIVDANGDEIRDFEIPSTVTSISSQAFKNCTRLNTITSYALTPPTFGNNALQGTQLSAIYVDPDSVDLYKAASGWSNYANIIQAIPDPTVVATVNVNDTTTDVGLVNNSLLSTVKKMVIDGETLSSPVSTYQFNTTGNHQVEIYMKDNTIIPGEFFGVNNKRYTSIELDDTVTTIGGAAFRGCRLLTSFEVPPLVTTINGWQTFQNCTSLTTVVLPSGFISLGNYELQGCSALANINLPEGMTSLGANTLSKTALTSITIPSTMTNIANALYWCNSLAEITCLATTPPTLNSGGLDHNSSLTRTIYVPAASVDTYKAASNWSDYASEIQAIPQEGYTINYRIKLFRNLDDPESYQNIINESAFYIENPNTGESEFSIDYFDEIVNSISLDGHELLVETEEDLRLRHVDGGLYEVELVLNSDTVPPMIFSNIPLYECNVGEGITTIGPNAFTYGFQGANGPVNGAILNLPSTITEFQDTPFNMSDTFKLYMNALTPPVYNVYETIDNGLFEGANSEYIIIFVPDAAVNTYKAHATWSAYANNIRGIHAAKTNLSDSDFGFHNPSFDIYEDNAEKVINDPSSEASFFIDNFNNLYNVEFIYGYDDTMFSVDDWGMFTVIDLETWTSASASYTISIEFEGDDTFNAKTLTYNVITEVPEEEPEEEPEE